MSIRLYTSPEDLARYGQWIKAHPEGSLWQSLEWKTYQEALGREVRIYVCDEEGEIKGSALVVIDRTVGGMSTWEIPRGPVWRDSDHTQPLVERIVDDAKKDGCLALYLSPAQTLQTSNEQRATSKRHQHPEATILIDLTKTEDEILSQMHQKGRYNIRLAEKHGVTVEQSADVFAYTELAKETGARDRFTPVSAKTYETFLRTLPDSFLMLAYHASSHKPIAGLLGVIWNEVGIYYYGASSSDHRALMAPSLVQWEAIKFCKAQGCNTYDLFGIAPSDQPNHPWSGVTDFKRKLGGTVVTYPPEQQIVLKPIAQVLLEIKRKILG